MRITGAGGFSDRQLAEAAAKAREEGFAIHTWMDDGAVELWCKDIPAVSGADQDRALRLIRDFIEHSVGRCFVLHGLAGTGKTHLMALTARSTGRASAPMSSSSWSRP